MIIRDGRPDERQALEDLQRRASLVYDEYRSYLLASPDAIDLPLWHLSEGHVRVAEQHSATLGFSVVIPRGAAFDLDGLFVEPDHWRKGIGRALVEDAIARLPSSADLQVLANPRAEAFYARLGFVAFETAQTMFGPARRMRLAGTRAKP